jgi:hypothetical protein
MLTENPVRPTGIWVDIIQISRSYTRHEGIDYSAGSGYGQ